MAKVLTSISRDSPASPVSADVGATFSFAGTPTVSGGGGVQRYDFRWELNAGAGYVPITGATGLTTADTNPLVNTNSQTQNAITVTCAQEGSYTIRMAGAPTSGGSYTVFSPTQTVTVTIPADTNDELEPASMTAGTPVLGNPTFASIHALTIAALAAGAPVLGQPGIGQVHALTTSELAAGAATLGSPTLAEGGGPTALEPVSLDAGTPALGSPAIAQSHGFSVTSLDAGSPTLGTPTLSQVHGFGMAALETAAPVLGAPSITQTHALTVAGMVTGAPLLGSPVLNPPPSNPGQGINRRCRRLRINPGLGLTLR